MEKFTHLHVHSEGSLIDGLGPVDRLVANAKEKGFDHLALTEHGTLSTAVTFSLVCEEHGIKPLLGLEGYISVDGQTGHITLLADGPQGFKNLVGLNNRGHERGLGRKPIFTVPDLEEHSDGLVLLTGCLASPFQQMSEGEAVKLGARLKSFFGHRFFAEAMFVGDTGEHFDRAVMLSERLNAPLVLTNDVHFPLKEDAEIHPLLTKMKAAYTYNSDQLWLKTPEEMLNIAAPIMGYLKAKKALELTHKIGQLIQPVNFRKPISLPEIPGISDPDKYLTRLVIHELANRGLAYEYHDRAVYELEIIQDMGFSKYFLILLDIVKEARDLGAKIGPGRGSGVGSLVLYLLGITAIDPLEHGLEFERFLNPHRAEFPDVDLDFDSDHRDELLERVAAKWDATQIATYSRFTHKVLTKDLARVLGLNADMAQKAADYGRESQPFEELVTKEPMLAQAYEAMLGQTRHRGKHAGGIVITDHDLPLERVGDRLVAAWTEGKNRELTLAGVVKFDLLGLTALSQLQQMEEMLGHPVPTSHDPMVCQEIFCKGDMTGIFQFSGSPGIVEMTVNVQPHSFTDLVAINALYRPGPLDSGTADHFVEWRKSPRKLHPELDPILAETYGVIVFQEQVMKVIQTVMGGSMGEADLARRLFSKPKFGDPDWEGKIKALEDKFTQRGLLQGFGEKLLEKLWGELVTHSRYSFNKSHATAYALIAYQMAWVKLRYPGAFYIAMLNYDPGNAQDYVFDAVRHGIEVKPPHVNVSSFRWELNHGKIYMPLNAVKWFGEKGAEVVVSLRGKDGDFDFLESYMGRIPKRSVNKRAREGLWVIGAFDNIPTKDGADPLEVLEIEGVVPSLNDFINQKNYLGFVLPTQKLLDEIKALRNSGYKAGVVTGKKKKISKYGPYTVYYLMPQDYFWTRPDPELETGDIVYAETTSFGKAIDVEKLH